MSGRVVFSVIQKPSRPTTRTPFCRARSIIVSRGVGFVEKRHTSVSDMRTRIMYIESKAAGLSGPARIARVAFSKTGATIYYGGRAFQSLKGSGTKANYFDVETGDHYWISGPRGDGADRLYGEALPVEIDDDVRTEYWTVIRGQPDRVRERLANR